MTQQSYNQPTRSESATEKIRKSTERGFLVLLGIFALVVILAVIFVKVAIWLGTIILVSLALGLIALLIMLRQKNKALAKESEERDLR